MGRPTISTPLEFALHRYAADKLIADLSSGILKFGPLLRLWRSAPLLDAALAAAGDMRDWLVGLAVRNGVSVPTATALRDFAVGVLLNPSQATVEEADLGQAHDATPVDRSRLCQLLGLGPGVMIAGSEPVPGHGQVSVRPIGELKALIAEGEMAARGYPEGSPEREEIFATVRMLRAALAAYAEHREDQRKWRAEKARQRKPLRWRSQTWMRVNRDPTTDGPRCA